MRNLIGRSKLHVDKQEDNFVSIDPLVRGKQEAEVLDGIHLIYDMRGRGGVSAPRCWRCGDVIYSAREREKGTCNGKCLSISVRKHVRCSHKKVKTLRQRSNHCSGLQNVSFDVIALRIEFINLLIHLCSA